MNFNLIISAGSVDGVLTSAALLRAYPNAGIEFTQAFDVNRIDPSKWEPGRRVVFVDLAVNNKDEAMTVDFVARIRIHGHEVVAIIDEHDASAWRRVTAKAGISFAGLEIKPVSQNDGAIKSSGALLLANSAEGVAFLGSEIPDEHKKALLLDADAGDRMDFTGHFADMANRAVKSDIANNARREYLARRFAQNRDPDETILGWCSEYDAIRANHAHIIGDRLEYAPGIVRVSTIGKKVDVTTLMKELYQIARFVIVETEAYVPAEKKVRHLVSVGTDDKSLDLLAALKAARIQPLGGFSQKVNIEPSDESAALEVISAL